MTLCLQDSMGAELSTWGPVTLVRLEGSASNWSVPCREMNIRALEERVRERHAAQQAFVQEASRWVSPSSAAPISMACA